MRLRNASRGSPQNSTPSSRTRAALLPPRDALRLAALTPAIPSGDDTTAASLPRGGSGQARGEIAASAEAQHLFDGSATRSSRFCSRPASGSAARPCVGSTTRILHGHRLSPALARKAGSGVRCCIVAAGGAGRWLPLRPAGDPEQKSEEAKSVRPDGSAFVIEAARPRGARLLHRLECLLQVCKH